jgi:K+-sensing histidine kinase KdpD
MSNRPHLIPQYAEQEKLQQTRLLHIILFVTIGAAAVALLLYAMLYLWVPGFPTQYLVPLVGCYIALNLLALGFLRRGHKSLAASLYFAATTATLLGIVSFIDGITGPTAPALILLPLIAALLAGHAPAVRIAIGVILAYLVVVGLQVMEVLQPWAIPEPALQVMHPVLLVFVLTIATFLVTTSVRRMQQALRASQQRGQELAKANRQIRQAAQVERKAREREEQIAAQLRQTVWDYSAFLEQVSAGDYDARLRPEAADETQEIPEDLLILGQHLNATVETLVLALADLQAVQQRYVRQALDAYASGAVQRGFRYRAPATEPGTRWGQGLGRGTEVQMDNDAWLASMTEAVRVKDVAINGPEMALPVILRGETIGAIGVCREGDTGWREEDLALAEAISLQLAQTIEDIRLLEETARHAAREQLLGQVTTRLRETLDVETVLRTAAEEARLALGLPEVVVRLRSRSNGSSPDQAQDQIRRVRT